MTPRTEMPMPSPPTAAAFAFGLLLATASSCLAVTSGTGAPPDTSPSFTAAEVAEDLDSLLAVVEAIHPAPFRFHERDECLRHRDEAIARAPLSYGELYARVLGAIALTVDGHTDAYPAGWAAAVRAAVPIKIVLFHDGPRVVAAAPEYASLVGGLVTALEGVPVATILDSLAAIVPSDNEWGKRELLEDYVRMPALLAALGIDDGRRGIEIAIAGTGARKVVIDPADVSDALPVGPPRRPTPDDWVDVRGPGDRSLWQRHLDRAFVAETLPDLDALYVQINISLEPEPGAFRRFVDQLPKPRTGGPSRLILDLRTNRGGDATILPPLVHAVIRHWDYLDPGALFVLTSSRTFSAAVHLAADLERNTQATFVGEPTAAPANHYADVEIVDLPNSGIRPEISALYWQKSDPRDTRVALFPDIRAPLTWDDFLRGRDPALEAIRALDAEDPRLNRQRPPVFNWLRDSQRDGQRQKPADRRP